MNEHERTRAEALTEFSRFATTLFVSRLALRSLMLCVSQHYNDAADDEVQFLVVASERVTPVWPHECGETEHEWSDYMVRRSVLPGESCIHCSDDEASYYFDISKYQIDWRIISAFEALCPEGASKDSELGSGYAPFAIARRVNDGVVVEAVGSPVRAPKVLGSWPSTPWADPRAQALLEDIGRNPDDDAPRVVLADHLQQVHPLEPLGEALALALTPQLGAAAQQRLDALVAEHSLRWLHPIGEVIAVGGAHFDRCLLRAADVYVDARTIQAVRGTPAWATVNTIRFAPGSLDFVDAAMTGLRSIGPLGYQGVRALGGALWDWAIAHLHVRLSEDRVAEISALAAVSTLPRLRTLVLSVDVGSFSAAELAPLTRAPWWPSLAQLTLLQPAQREAFSLLGTFAGKPVALAQRGDHMQPAGWQLRCRTPGTVEISQIGWHPEGTVAVLSDLVRALPTGHDVVLAPSPIRTWTNDDLAQLPATGRAIRLVEEL